MITLFFVTFLSFAISQNYTYSLEDINPNSPYVGTTISPEYFSNQITIHYFGKQT